MSELEELLAEKRRRELASTGDSDLAALIAERERRRRTQQPKLSRGESVLSGATDAATLGFGDELKGGIDAGVAAFRGQDAGRAYQQSVDASRAYQRRAAEDNPVSYLGGQFGGSLVPGTALLRGGKAVLAGSRSLNALATQRPLVSLIGGGAAGGAVGGGVYGAGAATEGNRLQGAQDGAVSGAAFGAAAGPAFRAAGATVNALAAPLRPAVRAMTPAPLRKPVGEVVDRSLDRMAKRRGLTEEAADQIAQEAEATGRNPLAAQVLGEPGLTRLQANARAPGRSGQMVADAVRGERNQQAARLTKDFDTVLPQASARQATGEIADQFEEASKTLYQPVLAREVDGEKMQAVAAVLQRLPNAVKERAAGVAARLAQAEGSGAQMTSAQQLHLLKRALDDTLSTMRREGLGADEFRAYTRLKRDFLTALDDAIPGYGDARRTWGGISEAREAMEFGQDFLTMRVDELTDYARGLSDAQRRYLEIGIRDRLEQLVSDVGSAPTRTNLAGKLEAGRVQERLRAVLGDRADNLLRRIGAESRDFRDQSRVLPSVNSPTSNVFNDLLDQAASVSPQGNVLMGAANWGWRKATGALLEGKRNRETETLLKRLTPAEIRALRASIRARMDARRTRAVDAVQSGAVGAIGATE